jgi:AbiJ N-terminal domain 4
MITDVFFKRYTETWFHGGEVPPDVIKFFRQAATIVFQDLRQHVDDPETLCRRVHDKLVRELGSSLFRADSYEEICHRFLFEVYDLWNDSDGNPDVFVKVRLSLIELLFREIEEQFSTSVRSEMALVSYLKSKMVKKSQDKSKKERDELVVFHSATQELNQRLHDARLPFHYHNGFLQSADDDLTTSEIEKPFWDLMADLRWENVDSDMKEAIDRRDTGGRDAAVYALKALESVLKIVSDEKGWTRGNERGAANYIDNLVSSTNGRFVTVWEADALKALFRDVRNPHSHGPGTEPHPSLTREQQTWVIETVMSWIKSLVRRI